MVRTFIFNIISRHHLTAITSVRLTPFMIYSLNELKNQTEKSSLNQRSFETTSRLFPLFTFFFLKNCIILPFCFMNAKPSPVMEILFVNVQKLY